MQYWKQDKGNNNKKLTTMLICNKRQIITFSHAIYEPVWRRQSSFVKLVQYSLT